MKEMKELPYTRQKRILERLNKNDCMTINELAKDFNVSQMTIYRDILQLEKSGDALRVYGGVKAVDKKEQGGEEEALKTSSILRPYCDVTIEERFNKQIDEKRAIARVAASYVKDGDVIAIDPSTTTLHMCSYLQNRKIIVVTTSISVALQFASSKSVDVILCGGMLRKRSLAIVGKMCIRDRIMDEPTSSLTRKEVNVLFTIIKSLQAKGLTILFVSHKLDEIIEIAERITVMRDGCIISTFENTDVKEEKLAQLISGQQITYQQKFTEHEEETVLEVERLSRARQYEDVSFSVKKGEIVGIIGLLGAGRTELASSIFGMNPPDSGRILLHGKEVKFKSNRDAIASRIAYVPEDRLLQGLSLIHIFKKWKK